MGRNAKLKKLRKETQQDLTAKPKAQFDADPTHFVGELERQGYNLQQRNACPEIPQKEIQKKSDPQV